MVGIFACPLFLSKETRYLISSKGVATEQDVRDHLGEPVRISAEQNHQTLWIYETREYVEGGNNSWTMTGSWWCDHYQLTFDEQRILRDWKHSTRRC
jgi:hypothetical protein